MKVKKSHLALSVLGAMLSSQVLATQVIAWEAGKTQVSNGDMVSFQGACYIAQNSPGVWETPSSSASWFWQVTSCDIGKVTPTPVPPTPPVTPTPTPSTAVVVWEQGKTKVNNGEVVSYQGACYQAKNSPGSWEKPNATSWFWNPVMCPAPTTPTPTITPFPIDCSGNKVRSTCPPSYPPTLPPTPPVTPTPTSPITPTPTVTPTPTDPFPPCPRHTCPPTPTPTFIPTPPVTPTPTATPTPTVTPSPEPTPVLINRNVLFDDFNYVVSTDMASNGWYVRSGGGGPGHYTAQWSRDYVTFFEDPQLAGNSLMRMQATTRGVGGPIVQSQVTYEGGFIQGTYAARVYFNNQPVAGPDGDPIVETFYTITPLNFPMDPAYSEMDFEYLANGGWGSPEQTMFMTTWETYQGDPWVADNIHQSLQKDYSGWHLLVMQVDDSKVRYYIDGQLMAVHGDKYYPESPMSINFNIWFINNGMLDSKELRVYQQDVDWMYFVKDALLSPEQVVEQVELQRSNGSVFNNSIEP